MPARECMSHFVYDLRYRPFMRDRPARVRGQIESDHCRKGLVTGRTLWARLWGSFSKVNLPDSDEGSHPQFWIAAAGESGNDDVVGSAMTTKLNVLD